MTQTPGLAGICPHIAIIGAGTAGQIARAALLAAGVTDVVTLDKAAGREVRRAMFDDDTDTWRLTTTDGEMVQAHTVVAADRPAQAPWLPRIAPVRARGHVSIAVVSDAVMRKLNIFQVDEIGRVPPLMAPEPIDVVNWLLLDDASSGAEKR